MEQHLCGMIPTTTGASVFTDEFHDGDKRQLGDVTAQLKDLSLCMSVPSPAVLCTRVPVLRGGLQHNCALRNKPLLRQCCLGIL